MNVPVDFPVLADVSGDGKQEILAGASRLRHYYGEPELFGAFFELGGLR
ncbi:MAG: hypothetical protein ABIB47_05140 [Candidatus Woesearchaeota archaeon]